MNSKTIFEEAVKSATRAILLVKTADYGKPTPATEWNVKTLASHMLYELSWTADIASGASIEAVGDKYEGDLIGNDLKHHWLTAEAKALAAVQVCDLAATAHLSWMDATNDYYLMQAGSDQLIHSWDLSVALSRPLKFDEELARAVYEYNYPNKQNMAESGFFKPALKVAKTSDIQTRLLALYGRDINWSP